MLGGGYQSGSYFFPRTYRMLKFLERYEDVLESVDGSGSDCDQDEVVIVILFHLPGRALAAVRPGLGPRPMAKAIVKHTILPF